MSAAKKYVCKKCRKDLKGPKGLSQHWDKVPSHMTKEQRAKRRDNQRRREKEAAEMSRLPTTLKGVGQVAKVQKFCTSCGTRKGTDWRFCGACGSKV
jgi:hypothetical protein